MAANLTTFGVVEQRAGQGHGADVLAQAAAAVEQDVVQPQGLGLQVLVDHALAFALVDEQDGQLGVVALRLGQHRHFAAARRAPGGPEVDHQWLADIVLKFHGGTATVPEGKLWQTGALLQTVQGQAAQAPAQYADGQRAGQRLPDGRCAPGQPGTQQQGGQQAGPGDKAAVTDIQRLPGLLAVVLEIHRNEGHSGDQQGRQQQAKQLFLGVYRAAPADVPAGESRQQQAEQQQYMGGAECQRPDIDR